MGAIEGSMETASPVKAVSPDQFVTFTCNDRAFGIDIMSVREIRSWSPTTELPNQPYGAKGVFDIRGQVVSVYDLAVLLGGGVRDLTPDQVVLVVSLGDQDVGLVVDAVSDIIFAQNEDFRAVPQSGSAARDTIVTGMIKNEDRLIAVLKLSALFPHNQN